MEYPSVSIILSFYQRFSLLERTLFALSNLDYPAPLEFVLIDDGNDKDTDKMDDILQSFVLYMTDRDTLNILHKRQHGTNTNILWNEGFRASHNEFVIFCMQDVIPSRPDFIQVMLENYQGRRVSVLPYLLSHSMTEVMDVVDWQKDVRLLETLPGFWTDDAVKNRTRKDASLLMNLSGQYRKDWEWFGLFRNDPVGYIFLDMDVALREQCLGRQATTVPPEQLVCYHQWHPAQSNLAQAPHGYKYHTERQARLLDPAEEV